MDLLKLSDIFQKYADSKYDIYKGKKYLIQKMNRKPKRYLIHEDVTASIIEAVKNFATHELELSDEVVDTIGKKVLHAVDRNMKHIELPAEPSEHSYAFIEGLKLPGRVKLIWHIQPEEDEYRDEDELQTFIYVSSRVSEIFF